MRRRLTSHRASKASAVGAGPEFGLPTSQKDFRVHTSRRSPPEQVSRRVEALWRPLTSPGPVSAAVVSGMLARSSPILVQRPIVSSVGVSGRYPTAEIAHTLILGSGRLPGLEVQVDANTGIAICGVVIAVASLGVSAYVARATWKHNRLSVRPLWG